MRRFFRFPVSLSLCCVAIIGVVGCGASTENTVVEAPADAAAQRAAEAAYEADMLARESKAEN